MKVANINSDATELELVVESDNYNLQTLFNLVTNHLNKELEKLVIS